MSFIELNLRICGAALLLLGFMHIFIPARFGWRKECEALTPLTREIHYVHHAFIGLFVTLNGALLAFFASDLLAHTRLAVAVLCGLGFFWTLRFLSQLFYYSPGHWRGKRFETSMHILFSIFWLYLATTLFAAAFV